MDPVDQLTMAVRAAKALRATEDLEAVLMAAYRIIEIPQPHDFADAPAVRIARLTALAGEHSRELFDYLEQQARGPFLNRLPGSWGESKQDESERQVDAEAIAFVEIVASEEAKGSDMFADGFPPFSVAERSISGFFGGRSVIERNGQRLLEEEAGPIQEGDRLDFEKEGLPVSVRGLIDYPLETPVLFTIEAGEEPWSLWDICCAFADHYAKIYASPERYGVWGHDIDDLWIERLVYFPDQRLIYPLMGS